MSGAAFHVSGPRSNAAPAEVAVIVRDLQRGLHGLKEGMRVLREVLPTGPGRTQVDVLFVRYCELSGLANRGAALLTAQEMVGQMEGRRAVPYRDRMMDAAGDHSLEDEERGEGETRS